MSEDKDFQLIKKFLAGNQDAFDEIVRKYQSKIYWHARRMLGNHLDADEVTQEVLITLYKKLGTFHFNSALFTWIYKITSTRSINLIKKRKVKKLIFFEDHPNLNLIENNDFIKNIDDKEKLEKLDSILTKLPVKQREVFIMKNFDQLSYKEISKITGKSIGGLKANYFYALKKVMELANDK